MIYLDSCIVIYLVEKHPAFYAPLDRKFRQDVQTGFAISPLVILECLVGPLKQGDVMLQARNDDCLAKVSPLAVNVLRI